MRFYLGTHQPAWLFRTHVPLFLSTVKLSKRVAPLKPATAPWALDSGGYSVLTARGAYPWSPAEYAGMVRRWAADAGNLEWAAIQDWMCEAESLAATGLSVAAHQARTVRSYLDLRDVGAGLPWLPVLQGYTRDDYWRCVDLYAAAGVNLFDGRLVGIGSVCRREGTREAEQIIRELTAAGLSLHGFGFKLGGVRRLRGVLASADSLAWSYGGRAAANKRRKAADRLRRMASLFGDDTDAPIKGGGNSPADALDWLDGVRVAAGIVPEGGLAVCPFCDSLDVSFPIGGELDYSCVSCGASWGDLRQPSLN